MGKEGPREEPRRGRGGKDLRLLKTSQPPLRTRGPEVRVLHLTARDFKPLVQIPPSSLGPAPLTRDSIPTKQLLCKDAEGKGENERATLLLAERATRGQDAEKPSLGPQLK